MRPFRSQKKQACGLSLPTVSPPSGRHPPRPSAPASSAIGSPLPICVTDDKDELAQRSRASAARQASNDEGVGESSNDSKPSWHVTPWLQLTSSTDMQQASTSQICQDLQKDGRENIPRPVGFYGNGLRVPQNCLEAISCLLRDGPPRIEHAVRRCLTDTFAPFIMRMSRIR